MVCHQSTASKARHATSLSYLPSLYLSLSVRYLGATIDGYLAFSNHITNFTRSSYFHLRRLKAIRKSVSISVFTSIVHAFVCFRIDYCNSLLIDLHKVRLSLIQTVINASARLIARLPSFSLISSFMTQTLHWLPFTTRIEFKVLFLVLKSQLCSVPKYIYDHIRPPYICFLSLLAPRFPTP